MSSIGGISGASSAASYLSVSRSQMREKAFAKVDADSSGSVDTTELQGMLDDITKKTGQSLGSADDLLATMDSDGSGSLSSDELDTGMKSLMPAPSSTVQFAQDRSAEGGPGGCGDMPPPPPPDGGGADNLMQSLMKLGDTDQDGTLSSDEAQTLKDSLTAAVDSALKSLSSSSDSSSTTSTASTSDSSAASTSTASTTSDTDSLSKAAAALIEKMTSMLLHRYGSDEASTTSGLSVAA